MYDYNLQQWIQIDSNFYNNIKFENEDDVKNNNQNQKSNNIGSAKNNERQDIKSKNNINQFPINSKNNIDYKKESLKKKNIEIQSNYTFNHQKNKVYK